MRRIALALGLALATPPLSAQLPRPTAAPAEAPAPAAQPTWTEGQYCWAYYEPYSSWYAAHVVSVSADSIEVEHFDGYREWVAPAFVRQDFIEVGDTVGAFFVPDGTWYQAVVKERRGMEIVVVYSDGEEETTWLKLVRVIDSAPDGGA